MEMNVGNDGNACSADNLLQRRRAFDIGAGHADDIDPRILASPDLVNSCDRVAGQRVGHGLHRNRRIAANGDVADHDLAGLTARYVAPGTD